MARRFQAAGAHVLLTDANAERIHSLFCVRPAAGSRLQRRHALPRRPRDNRPFLLRPPDDHRVPPRPAPGPAATKPLPGPSDWPSGRPGHARPPSARSTTRSNTTRAGQSAICWTVPPPSSTHATCRTPSA
ncbi:MAG: hypothetical protein ACJ736_37425 [Streptomyces sp.]